MLAHPAAPLLNSEACKVNFINPARDAAGPPGPPPLDDDDEDDDGEPNELEQAIDEMKASIAARALDFEELIKRNDAQRAEIEALTDFKTQVQAAIDVLSERTKNIDSKIKKLRRALRRVCTVSSSTDDEHVWTSLGSAEVAAAAAPAGPETTPP